MMKRKPKPRTRKRNPPKPKPKPAQPVINITIQVVAKKKDENSKAAREAYDKYVAERSGIKFTKFEMG